MITGGEWLGRSATVGTRYGRPAMARCHRSRLANLMSCESAPPLGEEPVKVQNDISGATCTTGTKNRKAHRSAVRRAFPRHAA